MPEKLSSAAAISRIAKQLKGTGVIYAPGCAAEPDDLIQAWRKEPHLAADLTFTGVWIPGVNKFDYTKLTPSTQAETYFLSATLRDGFEQHQTRYFPLPYTEIFPRLQTMPIEAAIIHTSQPDVNGQCSLGIAADFTPAVMDRQALKIGLLNNSMPASISAPTISIEAFDFIIETETPLLTYDAGERSDVFDTIAKNICTLIDNGTTLQFGLGKIQLSVLERLQTAKNLKIHAGMVSDPILPLLDKSVILEKNASVTTGVALGKSNLYEQVAQDSRVCFAPVSYTHDISILRQLDGFTAINSVIEIDLFGQANAEWINEKQVSGSGGLVDFLRGARLARGGKAVVALPSTASRGTASRIVPVLSTGTVPSITRGDSLIVITEFGIADLRGTDIDTRAERLIAIAHPDFRPELMASWDNMRRTM